ncbi:DUF924 family protein [Jannaschia sp. M317]|uniref:DUF924 family protein n=1 Tax=Jannaschia sp. M317 TaxID=2867011 RepID=UPI002882E205|nr:DUF924 family protein [Jannaschia sp. M317]
MVHDPEEVLHFWLEECGPQEWYAGGDALDARIRDRFAAVWEAARDRKLEGWRCTARGTLALLILCDQFPRNMFRGQPKAFATDAYARRVASVGISRNMDRDIGGKAQQFFYLPFEHSESLTDQERAVRLILLRMEAPDSLLHARAHRQVIRDFGRFPFRNTALGRQSSRAELSFLEGGAYGGVLRELQNAA